MLVFVSVFIFRSLYNLTYLSMGFMNIINCLDFYPEEHCAAGDCVHKAHRLLHCVTVFYDFKQNAEPVHSEVGEYKR